MDWQPMETAPRDGTWILGLNNRGNCAVIIWSDSASAGEGRGFYPGWIHPFSTMELSTFWNGANGSLPIAWAALPSGEELKTLVEKFGGREMQEINRARVAAGMAPA
jgi:hypothetical protein